MWYLTTDNKEKRACIRSAGDGKSNVMSGRHAETAVGRRSRRIGAWSPASYPPGCPGVWVYPSWTSVHIYGLLYIHAAMYIYTRRFGRWADHVGQSCGLRRGPKPLGSIDARTRHMHAGERLFRTRPPTVWKFAIQQSWSQIPAALNPDTYAARSASWVPSFPRRY